MQGWLSFTVNSGNLLWNRATRQPLPGAGKCRGTGREEKGRKCGHEHIWKVQRVSRHRLICTSYHRWVPIACSQSTAGEPGGPALYYDIIEGRGCGEPVVQYESSWTGISCSLRFCFMNIFENLLWCGILGKARELR